MDSFQQKPMNTFLESQVNTIIYKDSSSMSLIDSLAQYFQNQSLFGFNVIHQLQDFTKTASEKYPAVLVFSIQNTEELERALQFFSSMEARFSSNLLKAIVVLNVRHSKNIAKLPRGNVEVLDDQTTLKILNFKIRSAHQALLGNAVKPEETLLRPTSVKSTSLPIINLEKIKTEQKMAAEKFAKLALQILVVDQNDPLARNNDCAIQLIELFHQDAIFEIPDHFLNVSRVVRIEVALVHEDYHASVAFPLKVEELLGSHLKRAVVRIHLDRATADTFHNLIEQFEKRKEELSALSAGIRGVAA